jgi:hypothetical protein
MKPRHPRSHSWVAGGVRLWLDNRRGETRTKQELNSVAPMVLNRDCGSDALGRRAGLARRVKCAALRGLNAPILTITAQMRRASAEDAAVAPANRKLSQGPHTRAVYGRDRGLLRFGRCAPSESSIQTGAWSLAFSQPRTSRSTPAPVKRGATDGLRSRWSRRRPASRA